jgi:hypothetical protein
MKNFLVLCFLAVTFWGCEKEVDFNLHETPPKLVVEATIENDQPPVVILTQSLNYFSEINPQILAGSFVHNATIEVSNGIRTHRLKEYGVPLVPGYVFYYYSIDSSSPATAFTGQLNQSYSLRILAAGQEYTAKTTIPGYQKQIDSLWWKPAPPQADSNTAIVMVKATDAPGYGDYIRYFTKRNSEPFLPAFSSVFDDIFIDGTTYEIQVEPGMDRNAQDLDEENFFKRGDTVTFKISGIDKGTFDFWRTMEYSYASVGNPFSTPSKVISNISGNALGYFGGYASQYRTVIIPK